ncbi:MAG TPA: DUF3168 domain-containing protein [Hyphomicrobiales bacterium]|nr:DUF3168 domain-containing protein [Hyphomicrobiales bacterium]
MSAALALRAALHQRLAGDAALATILGGAKIYDEVPGAVATPYVVLSGVASRNVGTTDEPSEEHRLTVDVWSRQGGLAEVLNAAEGIVAAVTASDLAPAGYRVADLRWLSTEAKRNAGGRTRTASLQFRALTEPA